MKVQSTNNIAREGVALTQRAFEGMGFLFREQTVHDFGIDAHVEIVEESQGETHATGRLIGVQVKSGPSYFEEQEGEDFVYRPDDEHVQYWLNHSLPVILALCDIENGRVYWQLISESTVVPTGKRWKITVPKAQLVAPDSMEQLLELATKIIPVGKYSLLKQDDISVGIAKRYRLKVLLNATLTKPEIAAVIRQVVAEHAKSRYYRSEWVKARWGDRDASIISLFVYLSLDDVHDYNWICQGLWVDEEYPPDLPRPSCEGENIGSNILVDWSSRYEATAKHLRSFAVKKEDYLPGVDEIVAELVPIIDRIAEARREEAVDSSKDAGPVLQTVSREVAALEKKFDELGRAPLECTEVDAKLGALVSYAVNIVMPYLMHPGNPKRNKYVEEYSVEDFARTLPEFRYELQKVR